MITGVKPGKRAGLGIIAAAALLLVAGAVWMGKADDRQSIQAITVSKETASAVVTAASQPTLSLTEIHASSTGFQTSQEHPLTSEEVDRFASWHRERGATEDFRKLADGSFAGGDAFSGYRSTDDAGLAAFARQNDPYAAQMLGERLSERYREKHQSGDLQEAKRLLLEATMHGFTTSLAKLYELQLSIAQSRSVESRNGILTIDRQPLLEAYQYLYLLERRGDLSIDTYRTMAQITGKLNTDEDALVRNRAEELYQSMAGQRQQLGLQPFVDGVPSDIRVIFDRAMAGGK